MLETRKRYEIALSTLVSVPEVDSQSMLVILRKHPQDAACSITALNFGRQSVRDARILPDVAGKTASLVFSTHADPEESLAVAGDGSFPLELKPLQGKVFVLT